MPSGKACAMTSSLTLAQRSQNSHFRLGASGDSPLPRSLRRWQEMLSKRRRPEYVTKPHALGTRFDVIRRFRFTNASSHVDKRAK